MSLGVSGSDSSTYTSGVGVKSCVTISVAPRRYMIGVPSGLKSVVGIDWSVRTLVSVMLLDWIVGAS